MDPWGAIIRKVFFPLWTIYEGEWKILKYINYFEYLDQLTRKELLQSQLQRLKNILIHAYENTEYYKKLFTKIKFSPYKVKESSDIRIIPFLTKKVVREKYDELIAKNIPKDSLIEASTGGSTGVPMYFLRDRECIYLRKGQELYFDRWMGYKIGQKIGYFVAASHYDGAIDKLKAKIKNITRDRMLIFDPHNITDEYMMRFAMLFKKFKPEMIKCFPNALTPFAHFVKSNGISVPKVRAISCTGENLYKQQRELFENVFGGEVYEKVGTRESGVFACECKFHKGLHIFTEGVFIEILNKKGEPVSEGEMGKVYVTDLFNKAMPLIRYEIGDMAISGGDRICECGSQLPLVEKYLGRDRDIIIDSFGNPKPGYLFVEVIKNLNLNAQIQVYQPDRKSLIVRIAKASYKSIDIHRLLEEYQKIVGPEIKIDYQLIENKEIERDPSGKFSYVKSALKLWE
ncbi:MAG: phenylacetate--CoA ligase family protein [Candidatus Helarchaeota archaeon]